MEENFWAHWSNIEWLVAGIIAAGAVVAGFVWRVSLKLHLLEEKVNGNMLLFETMLASNSKDTERRHQENLHLQRGMQMRVDGLSMRIDRWVGK